MRFPCRPVDFSFFDTAPMRFKNAVELDASPDRVFSIFEDGESWPRWFRAIHKVQWTSDKPYGVGTTRTVWLTGVTLNEYVNLLRLSYAQALLMQEDTNVLDVAMESGFRSISAFNRSFRKISGKSPSDFRSELRH